MDFYTSYKEGRPVRLCENTRKFAYESLNHKYGLDTVKTPSVSLDHIENIAGMTEIDKYDAAIYEIAVKAPIRICENERISGAATLGLAINHIVPFTIGGNAVIWSISHVTLDFNMPLEIGINGIRANVISSASKYASSDCDDAERKKRFLKSAVHCLDCFEKWHERYIKALKDLPGYEQNYKNLLRVPFETPRSFYEAVQSLWFVFAFTRLCGNWSGIGRIDYMLGKYLKHDLESGIITLDEAREILAHFFIKGCEWITGTSVGSGDAQHYQNIVLSGIDENGYEITNEVTYLVLDIIEELGISDFPVTIRINSKSPEKLLKRAAEVIRHGGGVIAVYNEDLIINALVNYGYPVKDARLFANDGCWEVQIPGKTNFSYYPFDSLALLQKVTLQEYGDTCDFESFDALYEKYKEDLKNCVEGIYNIFAPQYVKTDNGVWDTAPSTPCTVVSIFEKSCIDKARSYTEGGAIYEVRSPHLGGLPDTANSLYAIKKLVFDDKKISFREFMNVLKNNWEGNEALRKYVLEHYTYFGNDSDEVDMTAAKILSDFADICDNLNGRVPIKFPAGVSTFGRQLEWAPHRFAAPYGRKKGEVLSGNMTPAPGTDKAGATAIIKSYCKSDLSRIYNGAALDIRLLSSDVNGEEGIDAIIGLIRGFAALGGFFMQMDVADEQLLLDAQAHPENYQTLSVRVSGWNARFVTLNKEWQDMIIQETHRNNG